MFKAINRFEAYEKDRKLYIFVKGQESNTFVYALEGLEDNLGRLSLMVEVLKRYSTKTSGVFDLEDGLSDINGTYESVKDGGTLVADECGLYFDEKHTPAAYLEFSDKNFYFTFDDDETIEMAYRNAYLIVQANNVYTALDLYRINHPDITSGYVSCSHYYGFPDWEEKIKKDWIRHEPVEIITAKSTMEKHGNIEYDGPKPNREVQNDIKEVEFHPEVR